MQIPEICSGPYKVLLWGWLIGVVLFSPSDLVLAQSSSPSLNPLPEEWILNQVASGEEADLKKQFPEEKDRVLSAKFLEQLLTNSLKESKVHRHGVQIRNAIVNEPLDLVGAEVPFEMFLLDCRFLKEVNLSKSVFMKGLSFDGSTFLSPARFFAMKVGGAVSFDKTIFMRGADFSEVETARNLKANGAEFRSVDDPAFFFGMKVGGFTSFISAKFSGPAAFLNADIHGDFLLSGTEFRNAKQIAAFTSMRVGGNTSFTSAKFSGPVNFFSADIRGHFEANGAEFTNANQRVVFSSVRVGGHAYFISARFSGPVTFESTDIKANLVAKGADFRSAEGNASFAGLKTGGDIVFEDAIFSGPVDFDSAVIAGHFRGQGASFRNPRQMVIFNNMKVGGHVYFFDVKFSGPVFFVSATIAGDFNGNKIEFLNREHRISFNLMKVGGNIYLPEAKFSGLVTFYSADIRGNFEANGAKFREVNFNNVKVGGNVFLPEVKFSGPVVLMSADIRGNFEANGTEFRDANLSNMKVGGHVNFQQAAFLGEFLFMGAEIKGNLGVDEAKFSEGATFMGADIKGNFQATSADFKNPNKEVIFSNVKVGGDVTFLKTRCSGVVTFMNAEIVGNVIVSQSKFGKTINFNTMKVSNRVRLTETAFSGPILMNDARFLHVTILGPEGGNTKEFPSYALDLSRTEIKGELSIKYVTLQRMIASALQVAGPTSFDDLIIEEELNLDHSSFANISLLKVTWPRSKNTIRLNGMSYLFISAGVEEDSWERLLELVKGSVYDANVYANLESFFRRQGYAARANKVFVEHKRIERREHLQDVRWFWSLLLEYLVWYGRKPELALVWSLFIIFLGAPLFRQKGMEPKNPTATPLHYNALWYSLDLFLPIANLQVANLWVPKKDRLFARNYVHIHKILGALLVPIGLAAVTGIIK
jgi:hypothetical protein